MSRIEIIHGTKYINGYLCNEAGRPITISNGYSSEDEKEASERYQEAKKLESEKIKLASNSKLKKISKKSKSTHNINTNDREF